MSGIHATLTIALLGLVGSLCLLTAGDAKPAVAFLDAENATRQTAVLEQHLVVLEVTRATGQPDIAESQATTLAASYLGTSSQATSVQARYVTLTLRNENGGVAWGIQAQPVWLVTFQGIAYPTANAGSSDCSCFAYFWRPSTVVALDARTGARILNLGIES